MKAGAKMTKFTKIISVMLAVILVVMAVPFTTSAATLGDVNDDGEITAVDARLILQVVAGLKEEKDLKNAAGADLNGDGITAVDARIILRIVAGLQDAPTEPEKPDDSKLPDAPINEWTKADFATVFNAETAKIAKGTYNWARICDFTKDIDVGNATATLNTIIKNVDANADLNSVVGGFIGVGNATGTQKDAGKYALIAMKLTESDIKSTQISNDQVTLLLNDSKNPSVGGDTTFNHISNDFVTKKDVDDAVVANGVSDLMTVKDFYALYHDVTVTAKIDKQGNPTEVLISYKMYASMGFKVSSVNMNGNGEVETRIKYTNLKY